MVHYYLDLETYGAGEPDPEMDEIIAITYCAIDEKTGAPVQEPVILKAWESSEKAIVEKLAQRMITKRPFDFIPVGFNVLFDLWFLKEKFRKYIHVDLGDRFYLERPYVDLKQALVFHTGKFKGVRIGPPGNPVHDWYAYQDYASIERHIRHKLEVFCTEWGKLR